MWPEAVSSLSPNAGFRHSVEEQNRSAVPRVGGMARANGVVIVSEHYWAFAGPTEA
jgi:hypothetical protein